MENETAKVLISLIPEFGVAALFFYVYLRERKINAGMVETLTAAYVKNTEAQTTTANIIANNTEAIKQLTTKVEEVWVQNVKRATDT